MRLAALVGLAVLAALGLGTARERDWLAVTALASAFDDDSVVIDWPLGVRVNVSKLSEQQFQRAAVGNCYEYSPAWSHDARLAFAQSCAGGSRIVIYDFNTGAMTMFSRPRRHESSPAWSFDGRLAFVSLRNGNSKLYVANADGDAETMIYDESLVTLPPKWSHDGRLALVGTRDNVRGDILVYGVDGDITNITPELSGSISPAWSSDGWLAFFHIDGENAEIYVWDGTRTFNATQHPADDLLPSWSPDGRLTFISDRDGGGIYTLDLETGETVRLIDEFPYGELHWSASGRWIAISRLDLPAWVLDTYTGAVFSVDGGMQFSGGIAWAR
jgi:Tol biopolymer transport system component